MKTYVYETQHAIWQLSPLTKLHYGLAQTTLESWGLFSRSLEASNFYSFCQIFAKKDLVYESLQN